MKSAIEWFKEKGFTFDDKITIADVVALQGDARKDGLMEAQVIASDVMGKEATRYTVVGDPVPGPPAEMALDGVIYKVTSAIVAKADELEYLAPTKK